MPISSVHPEYHWRKDKNDNQLDEPVKFKDHLIDAMRYAIYTHCKSSISVPRITTHGIKHIEPKKDNSMTETINTLNFMSIFTFILHFLSYTINLFLSNC